MRNQTPSWNEFWIWQNVFPRSLRWQLGHQYPRRREEVQARYDYLLSSCLECGDRPRLTADDCMRAAFRSAGGQWVVGETQLKGERGG